MTTFRIWSHGQPCHWHTTSTVVFLKIVQFVANRRKTHDLSIEVFNKLERL